ncbi:MAG: undecaprenyl-diphosphate phosphatase [bacterium]|nr:MAG: undecaprenyl-diphosphate phosphatase [bacterium]
MLESILLGILQGLTEFLPVSSSGHLVLVQSLLTGFNGPAAAFDVLLHGGTLVAVLVYFRKELAVMAREALRPRQGGLRMPLLILAGSLPAGIVGVFFSDLIEPLFSSPGTAAAGLVATGLILVSGRRLGMAARRPLSGLTLPGALLIGLFQAFAIVPGVSRSGVTITAGILAGLSGTDAARFSFILSLPAVAGALLLESGALAGSGMESAYLAGAFAAALTGWAAIAMLMKILGRGNLLPFGVYCLAVGSLSLLFLV